MCLLNAIRGGYLEDDVASGMSEIGNLHIGCRLDNNCARLLAQPAGNVAAHIYAQLRAGDAGIEKD